MMERLRFHWTTNLQNFLVGAYPCALLFIHNIHEWGYFTRRFMSHVGMVDEDTVQLFESELVDASSRRARPLRKTKLTLGAIDDMECSTLGSFTFRAGPFFMLSKRLSAKNVDEMRQQFPNLASLLGRRGRSLHIDSSALSDVELKRVLLSKRASKFAVQREVLRGDSPSEVGVPGLMWVCSFCLTAPIMFKMKKVTKASVAFATATAVSLSLFYPANYWFARRRVVEFDKDVCRIDKSYALGCRRYLKTSMELGKLLYEKSDDPKMKKLVAPNGDLLFHKVPYSERLDRVNKYIKNLKRLEKMGI